MRKDILKNPNLILFDWISVKRMEINKNKISNIIFTFLLYLQLLLLNTMLKGSARLDPWEPGTNLNSTHRGHGWQWIPRSFSVSHGERQKHRLLQK